MPEYQRYDKSPKQIAKIVDCHPKTIIKHTKEGKIPAKVIGTRYKYNEEEVRLALSNQKKPSN